MSHLHHVIGDLLASDEAYIAHGCNTHGAMGAGIALFIANEYPRAEIFYKEACREGKFLVGTVQPIPCVGVTNGDRKVVINLGTQRAPGADGEYWAIMLAFGNLFEWCIKHGVTRVGIPRVGCGIAGLEWDLVETILTGMYQYRPNGPEIVVYTHPREAAKWGMA